MEDRVLRQVNESLDKAIVSALTGYNSPLNELVSSIINKHIDKIKSIIDGEVSSMLTHESFKDAMRKALNDKLARILIEKTGGEIEKRVNELKQDPTTRAKITLAIANIIEGKQ